MTTVGAATPASSVAWSTDQDSAVAANAAAFNANADVSSNYSFNNGTSGSIDNFSVPRNASRLRQFRGKSISSQRPFDVFREVEAWAQRQRQIYRQESPSPRVRSKSVASTGSASPPLSDIPPVPTPVSTSVLSPKPINIPVPPNFKAFETFKTSNPVVGAKAKEVQPPPSPSPKITVHPVEDPPSRRYAARPKQHGATCDTCDTPAAQSESAQELQLEERQQNLRREVDEAARLEQEVACLEAETGRILAEQQKLDIARLQTQLTTSPPPKSKRPIMDKISLFSRTKKSSAQSQPGTPSTAAPTVFSVDYSCTSSLAEPPSPSVMAFMSQESKGGIRSVDAPTSAINGGDRFVTTRCLSSTISLPVTADTSPIDILQDSARKTRHHVSTATSVVVERYSVLGLERRLRWYERIRDVINSWDNDDENSLLILSCGNSKNDNDLEMDNVPRADRSPLGFSLQMHHSSRPGKWNKRYVTLLENGQMFASKRADAQPSDKDCLLLCHLSDFDIYTPKESEMRRCLKPPKTFCYAIKSQQKTVVFPDGENYVHFFCTESEEVAERFYELVHNWRSWYLVNKQIDMHKKDKAPRISYMPQEGVRSSGVAGDKSDEGSQHHHGREASTASASQQPLMDVDKFSKLWHEQQKQLANENAASKRANALAESRMHKTTAHGESDFAPNALLGDAYDKRRQDSDMARPTVAKAEGPFTRGPNLLNGGMPAGANPTKVEPKSWFPSATEHSARARHASQATRRPKTADASASRRDKSGTLLNLPNSFPEPPRRRDGAGAGSVGYGIRPPAGSPLINFASGGVQSNSIMSVAFPTGPQNRRGAPSPSQSPLPPRSPAPGPGRARSRSNASSQSGRWASPQDCPTVPVPPLPSRSVKPEPSSGSPLIGYAK